MPKHLFDILEKAKLLTQKTDEWLPRLGQERRDWTALSVEGFWEVIELFCIFIVTMYMFVKTHRIVHHTGWNLLCANYPLILK